MDLAALLQGRLEKPEPGKAPVAPARAKRRLVRVDHDRVRAALTSAIESGESVTQVAERLRVDVSTLAQHKALYERVRRETRERKAAADCARQDAAIAAAEAVSCEAGARQRAPDAPERLAGGIAQLPERRGGGGPCHDPNRPWGPDRPVPVHGSPDGRTVSEEDRAGRPTGRRRSRRAARAAAAAVPIGRRRPLLGASKAKRLLGRPNSRCCTWLRKPGSAIWRRSLQ